AAKSAIEVVVPVHRGPASAKAVRSAACGSRAANRGDEVHRRVPEGEAQISVDVADPVGRAKSGGGRGRRSAHEENRNAEIHGEMAVEIVAGRGIETRHRAQSAGSADDTFIPDPALAGAFIGLSASGRGQSQG